MRREELRENRFVGNELDKQKRNAGGHADCGYLPETCAGTLVIGQMEISPGVGEFVCRTDDDGVALVVVICWRCLRLEALVNSIGARRRRFVC